MKDELFFGGLIILISIVLTFLVPQITPIELSSLALLSFLLHNLGFAFGLGGDLISDYFTFALGKNKETKRFHLTVLLPKFKSLILVGFILMLIVHIGELISEGPNLLHLLKVGVLIPIGIAGFYMTWAIPKLRLYLDRDPEKFAKLNRWFNIVDLIALVFWIADLVLNTIDAPTHGFAFLLGGVENV